MYSMYIFCFQRSVEEEQSRGSNFGSSELFLQQPSSDQSGPSTPFTSNFDSSNDGSSPPRPFLENFGSFTEVQLGPPVDEEETDEGEEPRVFLSSAFRGQDGGYKIDSGGAAISLRHSQWRPLFISAGLAFFVLAA